MSSLYVKESWKNIVGVTHVMRWLGLYVTEPNTPRKLRVANGIICCIVGVYLWSEFIRSATYFTVGDTLGYDLFYKIIIFIIRLQVALTVTIISVRLRKIHVFERYWIQTNHWKQESLRKRIVRTTGRVYKVTFFGTIVMLTLEMGFYAVLVTTDLYNIEGMQDVLLPNWASHTSEPLAMTIGTAYHALNSMTFILFLSLYLLYFALIYCTNREFGALNETLDAYVHQEGMQYADVLGSHPSPVHLDEKCNIEEIRLQHNVICRMMETFNDVFSIPIGLELGSGILIVCLCLYNTANGRSQHGEFTFTLVVAHLATGTCGVFGCVIAGIFVNDKAHGFLSTLYNIDTRQLGINDKQQVQMFVHRLTSSNIGVSVMGLFVISRESVLTIFGALLTYAIVVFQFPEASMCCPNIYGVQHIGVDSLNTTVEP